MEWRPIETAPKDGTELIASRFWGDGSVVAIMHWLPLDGDGFWDSDGWDADWEPTHWIPLPPPPKAGT